MVIKELTKANQKGGIMPEKTVSAKLGSGESATVTYNFGDSLEDAVERFGGEVVMSTFLASAVISLQGYIRRLLTAKKSPEEIAASVATWKPGVKMVKTSDPVAALMKKAAKMTPEAIEALIVTLRKRKQELSEGSKEPTVAPSKKK